MTQNATFVRGHEAVLKQTLEAENCLPARLWTDFFCRKSAQNDWMIGPQRMLQRININDHDHDHDQRRGFFGWFSEQDGSSVICTRCGALVAWPRAEARVCEIQNVAEIMDSSLSSLSSSLRLHGGIARIRKSAVV